MVDRRRHAHMIESSAWDWQVSNTVPNWDQECRARGLDEVIQEQYFGPPGEETRPAPCTLGPSLGPCCSLANPRPRTRSYGHGGADLPYGRHGEIGRAR